MSGKTLNDYIPILKGPQQEYIVFCVQKYADRPDFHRGLLPFLPAEEAARCLEYQLEFIKEAGHKHASEDEKLKAVTGERFIRQIISVFRNALIYRLSEDETSEVIYLKTVKLKKHFGARFDKKFCFRLVEIGMTIKPPVQGLYELQMISKDRWKVTGHKEHHWSVCSFLSDCFGPDYTGI